MILLFDTEQNKVHSMKEKLNDLYPLYIFHIFPMVSINKQKIDNLSRSLSKESFNLWLDYNNKVLKDIIKYTENFNNNHIFILNIRDEKSKKDFKSLVNNDKYKIVTDDIFNNKEEDII